MPGDVANIMTCVAISRALQTPVQASNASGLPRVTSVAADPNRAVRTTRGRFDYTLLAAEV